MQASYEILPQIMNKCVNFFIFALVFSGISMYNVCVFLEKSRKYKKNTLTGV